MKILQKSLLGLLFTIPTLVLTTTSAHAVTVNVSPSNPDESVGSVTITFSGLVPGKEYAVCRTSDRIDCRSGSDKTYINSIKADGGGEITITACGDGDKFKFVCGDGDYFHGAKTYKAYLFDRNDSNTVTNWDKIASAEIPVSHVYPNEITVTSPNNKPKPGDTITIKICTDSNGRRPTNNNGRNTIDFDLKGVGDPSDPGDLYVPPGSCATQTFTAQEAGTYTLDVTWDDDHFALYQYTIQVDPAGGSISNPVKDPTHKDKLQGEQGQNPCSTTGVSGNLELTGCKTGLGNIPTNPKAFATTVLEIATGLAGGIALILMVIGSIRVLTSSGDQQKLSGGRDMIVGAISGLIFLIFSVLILKFIGINIFGL